MEEEYEYSEEETEILPKWNIIEHRMVLNNCIEMLSKGHSNIKHAKFMQSILTTF